MTHIALLHDRLHVTILLYMTILGVWGLFNFFRRHSVTDIYEGALTIGALLLASEVALGIILFVGGARPARSSMHIIYGIVAVVCIPLVLRYTRTDHSRQTYLVYSLVCFFLAALAIRAWQTGSG